MSHRVAEIDIDDLPSMTLELMDNHIAKILVIDSIVRTEGGCVVIEHNRLVVMMGVVGAEISDQSGDFPLELYIERLDDLESPAVRLTRHNPVDIGCNTRCIYIPDI